MITVHGGVTDAAILTGNTSSTDTEFKPFCTSSSYTLTPRLPSTTAR